MKYFVVINKHDVTKAMLDQSGLANSVPIPIETNSGKLTNYVVIGVKESNLNELKGYIKYSSAEVVVVIDDIRQGKKVNTRLVISEKQSVWTDPEGARARYQSVGSIQADETTSIYWTADQEYYIDGVRFYIEGAEFGDSVNFEIWHPVVGLVDSFVTDWYVWDGSFKEDTYAAKLLTGLQIKITLNKGLGNKGTVKCLFNAKLHTME